jgi:putative thioredoxin
MTTRTQRWKNCSTHWPPTPANDDARHDYVKLLELLTPAKPKPDPLATGKTAGGIEIAGKAAAVLDPQAQLVATYRRRLSMALN